MVLFAYLSPLQQKLGLKSTHSWQCFGGSWEAQERMVSISSSTPFSNLLKMFISLPLPPSKPHNCLQIAYQIYVHRVRETLVLSKNLVLGQTPQSPQHPVPFCLLPVWEWGWLWGRLEVVFPVHVCMYIHTRICIQRMNSPSKGGATKAMGVVFLVRIGVLAV